MFSQPRRGRRSAQRVSSLHRASILFGLVLIMLSSIGGSLAGLEEAWAQDDPAATQIPDLVDDTPVEEEQKPEEQQPEEPKPTEPVKGDPLPTEEPKTEAPDQVEEPPVETKIVETEAVATEAASAPTADSQETPSPTPENDPDETGTVYIIKYTCPEGYDTSGADFVALEEDCRDDAVLTEFTVATGGMYSETQTATLIHPPFMQMATFLNVPTTGITITERTLPGFGEPIVYCAGGARAILSLQTVYGGNTVYWNLDPGPRVTCYFFNTQVEGEGNGIDPIQPIDPIDPRPTFPGGFDPIIAPTPTYDTTTPSPEPPIDPEETGSVHIVKYTCPQGYDTSGADFVALEEDCRDDAVLTEFTVATGGVYSETQAARLTLPPFMQEAKFEAVPATTISITETILPGFGEPIVYCAPGTFRLAMASLRTVYGGNTIFWDLEAGSRLTCYYFNTQVEGEGIGIEPIDPIDPRPTFPGGFDPIIELRPTQIPVQPTQPGIPQPKPITGTVTVTKYTCPAGTERNDESFRLYEQCQENTGLVEFTVRGKGGYGQAAFADGSIPRAAVFTGVPYGQVEISETIPAGYGEPLAFCSDRMGEAMEPVPVDGNTVTWNLRPADGSGLRCLFFNVLEKADGLGAQRGWAQEGLDLAEATATPEMGVVEAVPTEAVPQLVDPTVISIEPELDPTAADDPEPAEDAEPTAVATVVIRPVIPADPPDVEPTIGRVTVNKLTCAVGIARSDVLSTLFEQCSENLGPVEFSVTGDGGYSQSAFTPDAVRQVVDFADVPFGMIQISETVPAGYGVPLVWCSDSAAAGLGSFTPMAVVGGNSITIEHRADAEDELRCGFVNFQEAGADVEPETGTVRVSKYTCPAGVTRSEDDYLLSEQCREDVDLVEFSVTNDAGFSQSASTSGVPQYSEFTDVPLGAIEVSETVPAGYGEPLAFCSDTRAEGEGNYEPVPVSGGAIAWTLRADAEIPLTCLFFNFVEDGGEPGTGTVRVSKYTCLEGVGRSDDDYLLSEQCREEVAPVEFTVSDGGFTLDQTQTASAGVPQETTFTNVPFGPIAISEAIPAGYGTPQVFCTDTAADGPGAYEPVEVVFGSAVEWELDPEAGIPLTCLFFNFPEGGGEEDNQLTVTKFDCPEGADRSGGLPDLGTTCDIVSGVEFTAAYGGSSSTEITDGGGNAGWTGVPVGPWSVQEAIPAGYSDPKVYCGPMFTTEAPEVPSPGGLFAGEFTGPSEHMVCTVFNFQEGDDPGAGTVRVSKYTCPAGVERSEDDYLLSELCREDVAPVEFSVRDETSYGTSLTATGGVPLETEFTGVPFGEIQIEETVVPPYGEPLVFCTDTPADGAGNYEPVPVVDGDTIAWTLRADAEIPLTCLFFNFHDQAPTGNLLRIAKWDCPPDIDRESGLPTFGTTCDRMPGIPFSLEFVGGDLYSTTDSSGEIAFEAIPAGAWSVQEEVPVGYGDPVVFCGPMFETETPKMPAPDGRFSGEFTGSDEVTSCSVFNLPEQSDNTVTVNKYICPPDANPEEVILLDVCSSGGDGIQFEFVDGLGSHYDTVSGGVVEWTGVVIGTEGELQIIETIPDGYSLPFVLCDGLRMDANRGFVVPNPGGEDPFHTTCNWFNFIAEDSSLTVIKHDCPAGYDLKAEDSQPFEDCLALVDGVDFHLGGPATDLTATTGDAGTGTAWFSDIDAGNYILTETVPEGTEFSFVADCYGNAVGSVHPYPLATGDTLNLTINAGEQVTCYWFNVPEQEGGELTVIKYTCATKEFVSEVDCEIFEDGHGFDLLDWNGSAYVFFDSGITDGAGRLTWTGLEEGSYLLDEHDREWCHLTSSIVPEEDLNGFMVIAGQEQVVKVYNCDGVPGKPGKIPTKYPDTGVPPSDHDNRRLQP